MKLSVSTLGCPDWSLEEVCETAAALGFDGVELRLLDGKLDLLGSPRLRHPGISSTLQLFERHRLEIVCVDTSCSFDSPDRNLRQKNVGTAVLHAQLARDLGAPLIRVFPNEIADGASRSETEIWIAESLRDLADCLPSKIVVGLETHGDFARAEDCARIMKLTNDDRVAVIWDAANSTAAGDSPERAVDILAPYLVHVHLRDARPEPGRVLWQPVLAGRGAVPFEKVIRGLEGIGYGGYVCYEWEKYWHPEIERPEVAFPDFKEALNRLL